MKKVTLASLFCLLTAATAPCLAIKPVSGVYAGVFLGPTFTPSISFNFNPKAFQNGTFNSFQTSLASLLNITVADVQNLIANKTLRNGNIAGSVKYSVLGGIGGDLGYRFCDDFRLEGEILYNNNPISELKIGPYSIPSSKSSGTFHISGDTNTASFLFNFLYDVPIQSKDGYSATRPYIGAGLGYAYVFSSLQFHYGQNLIQQAQGGEATTLYEKTFRRSYGTMAVQGILGLSYSIDDFCWLSIDGRYFATPIKNNQLKNGEINFQSNLQLYSVMLGFHGVFNSG